MPTNHELEIIMRLKDEISQKLIGVQGALQKLSNRTKDVALEMRKMGREMSYVGMSMTAVGTAITAPLALAYKNAGKFNADIAHQLRQTQNVFDNLSLSIGKSLLPVMKQLTDSVANAVGWWNSLEQATRDKIIQNVWNLGKSLVALGISLVVIGKTMSTLANLGLLLANFSKIQVIFTALMGPIGWVTIGFVMLTVAMLKWKSVADAVMNTAQSLAKASFWGWIVSLKGGQEGIDKVFGKDGDWAKNLDNFKQQFTDFGSFYKEIMGSLTSKGAGAEGNAGGFWSGFELSTIAAMDALRNFQQLGMDVATQLTTGLSGAFSSFIDDAFSGQLRRAQDYFAEFGKSILSMFGQVISKMIAEWMVWQAVLAGKQLVGNILNILGGLGSVSGGYSGQKFAPAGTPQSSSGGLVGNMRTMHTGGIIRAHSGLAIDEVPIIAQSGERILSRRQNAEYEKGGSSQKPTVIVIQAWDTQDIMRNRKSIEGVIINALKNNSGVRGAVKTYG